MPMQPSPTGDTFKSLPNTLSFMWEPPSDDLVSV
jgi:hypothetical protein